ncbi:MAG TPA: penicillin-binding transpeptidase domain-containing protein [Pyrinomonadaceae bacterium]|nr:penicillin-binding transpeptidase domain-containing protein [Pyrinomonadaceae bacterium]
MLFLLLLQAANSNANAAAAAAAANPSLEKKPALLSLIYMGGLALMILWLIVALIRYRRQRSALAAVAPEDLPDEVRQRLGSTTTNRGLRFLRIFYIVLALAVFGFHVYWARYAAQTNERFQELGYKDLRNRRLSESTLRGWILDRTGKLENALALYRRDGTGSINRDYQMDTQFAHLFGSDRGDPGLERSLFGIQSNDVPEALQVVMGENIQQRATRDIQLTIHHELQQTAVDQLKGKHGAVVVFNPQTGEVLAMYSNPSYSLKEVQDEARWIQLDADERDKPLVNRALGSYYIPGSTFKTFIMIAAHRAGIQDTDFICSGGGFYALPGAKPIFDDGGPGEVHGQLGIDRAYEVSCNQYFAQMAVKLGPERLKETAKLLGVGAYDTPEDLIAKARRLPEIWNASSDAVKKALAPRESKIVAGPLGRKFNKFDLALEGYGQGYAGQMTPFQMALFAASIGNLEGKLMKPRIEMDRPNEVYNQVTSPQIAARLREIMGLVTGGPEGTARGVFGPVKAAGITSGGKTGTAQKDVPVYDPKTGEPVRKKKYEKDPKGNIIREYEVLVMADKPRIDGWFLCIAPLENPQIAMAVIVEGGGYGSKSAAPIAAQLVLKAKEIGLLGGGPQQKKPNETAPPQNKRRQPPKSPAPKPTQ